MKIVHLSGTGDEWTFHRLPQALDDLGIRPRHVFHVGANLGQEVPDYRAAGIERITLVEPDPDSATTLRETYPELSVLQIACGTTAGTGTLRRSEGASVWSTLAESPMPHGMVVTDEAPVAVFPVSAQQGDADMIVIDTQGTELDVLRSVNLTDVKLIVIETHDSGDPNAHAGSFSDVCRYMAEQGWTLVLQWLHEEQGSAWFATYADTFFAPGA